MSGRRRFISPKWFHRATRLCFRAFDAMKLMTSGASPIAQMSGAVFSATPPTPRWPRPPASAARATPDHRLRGDHRSLLTLTRHQRSKTPNLNGRQSENIEIMSGDHLPFVEFTDLIPEHVFRVQNCATRIGPMIKDKQSGLHLV